MLSPTHLSWIGVPYLRCSVLSEHVTVKQHGRCCRTGNEFSAGNEFSGKRCRQEAKCAGIDASASMPSFAPQQCSQRSGLGLRVTSRPQQTTCSEIGDDAGSSASPHRCANLQFNTASGNSPSYQTKSRPLPGKVSRSTRCDRTRRASHLAPIASFRSAEFRAERGECPC